MTNRLRVLVVEDDALIAMLLSEMLDELGHVAVGTAATESEAVASAAALGPDFMIVDLRLREGGGLGAMTTILQSGPMPHVFMSGAVREPPPPGAVLLQKPFSERDLARAIERAAGALAS